MATADAFTVQSARGAREMMHELLALLDGGETGDEPLLQWVEAERKHPGDLAATLASDIVVSQPRSAKEFQRAVETHAARESEEEEAVRSPIASKNRPLPYRVEAVFRTSAATLAAKFTSLADRLEWDEGAQAFTLLQTFDLDTPGVPSADDSDTGVRLAGVPSETLRLLYYRNTSALGGAISSRDFVDLNFEQRGVAADGRSFTAPFALPGRTTVTNRIANVGGSGSIVHLPVGGRPLGDHMRDAAPSNTGAVRGVNYPTGWIFEDLASKEGDGDEGPLARMTFAFQTDLKGWLPGTGGGGWGEYSASVFYCFARMLLMCRSCYGVNPRVLLGSVFAPSLPRFSIGSVPGGLVRKGSIGHMVKWCQNFAKHLESVADTEE
jgi:hypothetical protein